MSNSVQHFTAQKNLIHELFKQDDWLKLCKKEPNYPAVKRYKICEQIIAQEGIIKFPENRNIIPELTSILLDNYIFSKVSDGNPASFSLGNFANYGDAKVRQQIASQLKKTNGFQSLMTELSFGAWFLSKKGFQITATEDEGLADFKIDIYNHPISIAVECKHIDTNTNDTRYQEVIKKANKQIKNWKTHLSTEAIYGIVFIDVSNKFRYINSDFGKLLYSLKELTNKIQSIIRRDCSSVNGVLLICDSFQMSNEPGDTSSTSFCFARSGIFIRHLNPVQPLPDYLAEPFEKQWGYQTGYKVNWKHREFMATN
ncbi:hypothetical protein [Nostoc piscinale]|nr:hypothetical protein [Nostoc piscinale]